MRRRIVGTLAVFAIVSLYVWLDPTRVVWGWLRGESFFQGRPTSYWAQVVEEWDPLSVFTNPPWAPPPRSLPAWIAELLRGRTCSTPEILELTALGEPVLHELQMHPNPIVRERAREVVW